MRQVSQYIFLFVPTLLLILCACNRSDQENGREDNLSPRLAEGRQLTLSYCTGCHIFPEPALLDRRTWLYKVLPNMGRRLGMTHHSIFDYPPTVALITQDEPQLSQQDWEKLVNYYSNVAPKSLELTHPVQQAIPGLKHFAIHALAPEQLLHPVITLLKIDTATSRIMVGDGVAHTFYQFTPEGELIDSLATDSAPVSVHLNGPEKVMMTVGILPPSDSARGKIIRYGRENKNVADNQVLAQGLFRPVDLVIGDLNRDGQDDLLVCGFGNNVGRLSWFENRGTYGYEEHILTETPGAVKAYLHDFNRDGLKDIIVLFAQGDERLVIYYNQGKGQFQGKVIQRFSPVYGSIYFEIHDFNRDGYQDILYVNGDNGDYSDIPKNYHGIRIFLNDGENSFTETFFYPLYGACRAKACDFDQDGDPDIVATATFVDALPSSQRSIVYLENNGAFNFTTYVSATATRQPWNALDVGDIDQDGDQDIVIGAMDAGYYYGIQQPEPLPDGHQTAVLFLENSLKK